MRWCQTSCEAWLLEGNAVAAMGYVSERSYACLAEDTPDPSAFDRGLAPVQILVNLKAAYDALGTHDSLEGLAIGVPLAIPGLRAVPQPIKPSSFSTTCPTTSRPGSTARAG